MHLRVSFAPGHVIFVDKADDTVHVVKVSAPFRSFRHLVSCFTHAPAMDFLRGIIVRMSGKVIELRQKGRPPTVLRLLNDQDVLRLNRMKSLKYTSEYSRALALIQ
jgi:hypothetical protein